MCCFLGQNFSHVPQIETLSRIVTDSLTNPVFINSIKLTRACTQVKDATMPPITNNASSIDMEEGDESPMCICKKWKCSSCMRELHLNEIYLLPEFVFAVCYVLPSKHSNILS